MVEENIISKLKKSGLLGRGGAGFPTWLKWQMVKEIKAKKKYIICNASEGEPGVFKDGFILENYPEEVIEGIKIALKTIDRSFAYIYLNKDYYKKFGKNLKKIIGKAPIKLFKKPAGYLAGEETSILEAIEGKRPEPRLKPPYPTEFGLLGCPTLVNNVETFYSAAKIAKNKYKNTRFYSIGGEARNKGVYELLVSSTIKKILKETKNLPDFDFFIQTGGGASGEILLPEELNQPVGSTGSIIIYNRKKTQPYSLMKKWVKFFLEGNCDKCVPCREGLYRIGEMIEAKKIDKGLLEDIFFVLEKTSFCPLGKGAVAPFKSLINKLLK